MLNNPDARSSSIGRRVPSALRLLAKTDPEKAYLIRAVLADHIPDGSLGFTGVPEDEAVDDASLRLVENIRPRLDAAVFYVQMQAPDGTLISEPSLVPDEVADDILADPASLRFPDEVDPDEIEVESVAHLYAELTEQARRYEPTYEPTRDLIERHPLLAALVEMGWTSRGEVELALSGQTPTSPVPLAPHLTDEALAYTDRFADLDHRFEEGKPARPPRKRRGSILAMRNHA